MNNIRAGLISLWFAPREVRNQALSFLGKMLMVFQKVTCENNGLSLPYVRILGLGLWVLGKSGLPDTRYTF